MCQNLLSVANQKYINTVLYIQISIDSDDFILSGDRIIAVIPYVNIQYLPGAPEHIAGILNFQGNTVPVLDITKLIRKRSSKNFLSTRIILFYNEKMLTNNSICGILAENVTEVVKLKSPIAGDVRAAKQAYSMYVDEVINHNNAVLQRLNMETLFAQGFSQYYVENV